MVKVVLERLSVFFGEKRVLRDISLELREGIYLLIGRNGSGKTTLMKTIAKLIDDYDGEIYVNDRNIREYSRREIATLVGYVWQNPYYGFIEPRVIDEVTLILKILKPKNYYGELIKELINPDLFNRDPFTLSGGEAKRVSLASVLIIDQPIWLLDEPFDYLDLEAIYKLIGIIHKRKREKLVMISTTNTCYLNLIEPDKVILLDRGEVKFFGELDMLKNIDLEVSGVVSRRLICG